MVLNSAIVTICVTLVRVFFVSLAGYALARLQFRGRGVVFAAVIAVMAVPGVVLLIPRFLVINQLGIYDSYAGMILPLLVDAAGVFIMKNFFESIPVSVEEQARIDGAGTFRIFWSVVLPMARPALITIIILSFQGSWNELSHFIVSTQSPELTTLTKGVASLASGQLSQGTPVPAEARGGAHHDDPRRGDVLHLPEADHEHERGSGQGMSDVSDSPRIRSSRCSTTPSSRCAHRRRSGPADSGDLGARAIHGVYHGDRGTSGRSRSRAAGDAPEWISASRRRRLARRLRRPAAGASTTRSPDPKVRMLRDRVVGDGAVGETLTIVSHVADPVEHDAARCDSSPSSRRCRRSRRGSPTARAWKRPGRATPPAPSRWNRASARSPLRTRAPSISTVDDGIGARRGTCGSTRVSASSVSWSIGLHDPTLVVRGAHPTPPGGTIPLIGGDPRLQRWLDAALGDLDALRLTLPGHPEDEFFAAGAPWFLTLFGRDSLWAARLALPVDPDSRHPLCASSRGSRATASTPSPPSSRARSCTSCAASRSRCPARASCCRRVLRHRRRDRAVGVPAR